MFPLNSIPSFLPCVRKREIELLKELRWSHATVLCWLQMRDSLLFIGYRGLKGNALFVQVEELQVVLGELHELSEGARLHPRSMTAHILLKIHRLHHLCQGQLPIDIRKIWIKNHYRIKKAQQGGILGEETNTSLCIYWFTFASPLTVLLSQPIWFFWGFPIKYTVWSLPTVAQHHIDNQNIEDLTPPP